MIVSQIIRPEVNIAGRLVVDGRSIAIGQVCQHSLVLAEPCELPPTDAKLILTVSGKVKVYDIFLPHGVSRNSVVTDFF